MLLERKNIKQTLKDGVLMVLLLLSCMVSLGLFMGISFFVIKNGLQGFHIEFLTSSVSIMTGVYGIKDYLMNTIMLLLLTLPIAGILGVFGAVYLCEYAKEGKAVQIINLAIEILAGIPSIVFGLFGMVFFGELLHLGYSLLTGALTLTLMILPVMIENTKEMLKTIPKEYRQGALGLGAGKWQMVRTILLPNAVSGIGAGFTLAAGKIMGESAALLFTAGSKGSLAVALYMMVGKGKIEESYRIALILFILIVLLNLLFQYIKEYSNRR